MNQKKAKRLHRIAEASTQGIPGVSYELGQPSRYEARRNDAGDFLVPYIFDKAARGVPKKLGYCTRSVYQKMKKLNG